MSHTNGIGGSPLLQTLLSQTETVSASSRKEQAAPGTPAATSSHDRTQFSTAANALLKTSDANQDVRTEKVAALQKAIADGSYSVSATDVADAVIRNLLS